MKDDKFAMDFTNKLVAIVMNKTQCDKATANAVAYNILFEVKKEMIDPLHNMIFKSCEKYGCTEVDQNEKAT